MRIDVARERGGVVAVQELVQGQLGVLGVGHVAGRDTAKPRRMHSIKR